MQSYLDSSFDVLIDAGAVTRQVDATLIAVRHRDLLRHARAGIQGLGRLLARASRIVDRLESPENPAHVRLLCDRIRQSMDAAPIHGASGTGPFWRTLAADRALRSEWRDELQALLDALAELDFLSGAARLLDHGYTLPEVVDDDEAHLEGAGVWHPFLPEGVPNHVSLRGGESLVFLTRPNMAGKTTYLRAVGLCVYLAQCGLPVPARHFAFRPVDRLFTSLSPEDNLRAGISFFLAEVRRVKDVVEAVARGQRTIAIFDEVFKGTNVADALEASKTVLLGCSRTTRSAFIFSSHLAELADELAEVPSIRFCYFDGELGASALSFDYHLRAGVSRKRFGMEVFRREGLAELLASLSSGART